MKVNRKTRTLLLWIGLLAAVLLAADAASGTNLKRGVGYTGGGRGTVDALGGSWVRTWEVDGSGWEDYEEEGVRFLPTIVRPHLSGGVVPPEELEELRVEARRNPGACWIVFNEPDVAGPGSWKLSVSEAVLIWPQIRDAILEEDPGACFLFGNVVWESYQGYTGAVWLEEFMDQYSGDLLSEIDGWGLHLYAEMVIPAWQWWAACPPSYRCISQGDLLDRFEASVERAINWANRVGGGLPIWFTEWGQLRDLCQGFACQDCKANLTCDYREALIRRMGPYFDRHPAVAGHAWFATLTTDWETLESGEVVDVCASWCPCCDSPLVDQAGLTALGEAYARPYQLVLGLVYSHFGSPPPH